MYSLNADTYLALRNYANLFAESALARRLEGTSPIVNGNEKTIIQDWNDFWYLGAYTSLSIPHSTRLDFNW